MHLKQRTTCRVCRSKLTDVLSLGEQYLQGSFVKGDIKPSLRKIPLTLSLCDTSLSEDACGLLQLKHSVPQEILYKNYWYRSGTNSTMKCHLKDIANDINELHINSIMDIGCNDGTLLKSVKDLHKIGVDPSNAIESLSGSGVTIFNECYPSEKLDGVLVDVITSIAMFYDVEDPVAFAFSVKQNLTTDGIWIFEVAYLPSMLKNNAFDNICHEHIEYYSLSVIERILKDVDMQVIRAEINEVNCGSILIWASNKGSSHPQMKEEIESIRQYEFTLCLDESETYYEFSRKVNESIEQIQKFAKDAHFEGKKIHAYGASTKGNVLIQACGIAPYIVCAADRNADKWGARTLGTDIPIISEEESRAMKPDYYLVLPWHFKKEFVEREKEAIRLGTKFIFPLPKLEII